MVRMSTTARVPAAWTGHHKGMTPGDSPYKMIMDRDRIMGAAKQAKGFVNALLGGRVAVKI